MTRHMLKCRHSVVCIITYILVHTNTHIHPHTHTYIRPYTQTCSRNRPSHSSNQFHFQASCQAAMLSKYYHNASVTVNMQLMNGWHPVKLRDTETEKLPTHCYCALTPPLLSNHLAVLTSHSFSLSLCDFLSLALCFKRQIFTAQEDLEVGTAERKKEQIVTLFS